MRGEQRRVGASGTPESSPRVESPLTPASLRADNRSPRAQAYLSEWREGLSAGRLTLVFGCADSRSRLPQRGAAVVRLAGAPIPPKVFELYYPQEGAEALVEMSHQPCGLLNFVKAREEGTADSDHVKDVARYAEPFVFSDPRDNAGSAVLSLVFKESRTLPPVLSLVQEHSSGDLDIEGITMRDDQGVINKYTRDGIMHILSAGENHTQNSIENRLMEVGSPGTELEFAL